MRCNRLDAEYDTDLPGNRAANVLCVEMSATSQFAMTIQEQIANGEVPVFERLCREISTAGYPERWSITREEWVALQKEVDVRMQLDRGTCMGVPLIVKYS